MPRPEAFKCEKVLLWSRFLRSPHVENLRECHSKGAQLSVDSSNNAAFTASPTHKKLELPPVKAVKTHLPPSKTSIKVLYTSAATQGRKKKR